MKICTLCYKPKYHKRKENLCTKCNAQVTLELVTLKREWAGQKLPLSDMDISYANKKRQDLFDKKYVFPVKYVKKTKTGHA